VSDNDENGDFTCLSVNVTVRVECECDWRESDSVVLGDSSRQSPEFLIMMIEL